MSAHAQSRYNPKYLREDNKAFRKLTRFTTESGLILFRKDTVGINPETFFDQFSNTLGLNKHYRFKAVKDETDEKQIRHRRYQLFFKNIPVEGVEYLLHSKGNRMESANGRIVEDLDIDIDKPMPEKQALDYALADQKLTADAFKGKEKLPKGDLVIAAISDDFVRENFRLCYAFDIQHETVKDPVRLYVDAQSGAIVRQLPLILRCFGIPGHVHTENCVQELKQPVQVVDAKSILVASTFVPNYARYLNGQGALTFETSPTTGNASGPNSLSLPGTNQEIRRLNSPYPGGLVENVFNNQPIIVNATLAWANTVPNATTAHWLSQRTNDYFRIKHNHLGFNGTNQDYPRALVDAQNVFITGYDRNRTIIVGYGPTDMTGQTVDLTRSFVTADVMGHEYTHAIIQNTTPLVYSGESGAINESIADIFGTAYERYLFPDNSPANIRWNWNIAEDAYQLRDMENPRRSFPPYDPNFAANRPDIGQPDSYTGTAWWPVQPPCNNGNDNCGVHVNSGVMNGWFHDVANEDPNNNTFIGFDVATDVVYKALRYYMTSTSNYQNAREATWIAAGVYYGQCSDIQRRVARAWTARGLNIIDCPPGCDYSLNNITVTGNTNCNGQITLTTTCNGAFNESCDGVSYNWSGPNVVVNDASTTTATLPASSGSHIYLVSGIKSGCIPGSFRAVLIETNCGQPTCTPITSGNCYNIKVQKNGLRLQVMTNGTIEQQGTNNQNNQIWKAEDTGGSQFKFTTQDGTNRVITSNSGNFGEWLSLGGYSGAAGQKWYTQCNGSNHYRIYRDNGSTWDMKDFGNSPQLQLYGNTGEPFYDYRSFEFQATSCPTVSPPSGNFAVVAPAYNCQMGALTMQTSGGNGSTIEYQIPGLRGWDTNPNFTVPSWQLTGTSFTLQARQSGTQAPDYPYTTACGGTPPPTGGSLALTAPSLNCSNGNLTVNTSGGNGSAIEYQISGLQGWTTNNVMNVPTWQRNGTSFTIQARQSGVEASPFIYTSGCANYRLASVSKTEPEETLLVMPNPTTGRVTVRFRLVAGQAAMLRTTNSRGIEVNRRAVLGTGQEQEETLNLDREVPGLYLLNLQSSSKRQTAKVVLQR